jgi:hypothetical protein
MFDKYLSPYIQGWLVFVVGVVLFLHTIGVFTSGLSFVLILLSLGMILYGFLQADMYASIQKLLKKEKK